MRNILLVVLFMMVGCQKSEESTVTTPEGTVTIKEDKVVIESDNGRSTVETREGETRIETKQQGTMTFSESKVPEGFPLPVMPDATVEHGSHVAPPDGREVFQVNLRIAAPAGRVAEFYEKALKEEGFRLSRNDQAQDGATMIMLLGEADSREASAVIMQDAAAEHSTAMLTWGTRKN